MTFAGLQHVGEAMKHVLYSLVVAVALCAAIPAHAAVAHVKSGNGFCNNTSSGGAMSGTCATPAATKTFTYTPFATNANEGALFVVGCSATGGTPSAVTLTATSWTLTQVIPSGAPASGIIGSTTAGFLALFKAYVPSTSAATFTQTWTVASCSNFINVLLDEFSNLDPTNFIDAASFATANTTTSCNNISVTPTVANDGLWAGCNDNQTAAAAGWTVGANDTQSDIAVWKILAGGSGVSQSPGFSSSTGTAYTVFMVALKPTGGAVVKTCTTTLTGAGPC